MSEDGWEEVQAPQGTFIGWGKVGQTLTGRVVSYGDQAGTDMNGKVCPQLIVELTADTTSFRNDVEETVAAGEFATITCSQASLSRNIRAAALEVGNLVRITYSDTYKANLGTGKVFTVAVNRSAKPAGVAADSIV